MEVKRIFPLIRITKPAHDHLKLLGCNETARTGRKVSIIEYASAIFLKIPLNGNSDPSCLDPADPTTTPSA